MDKFGEIDNIGMLIWAKEVRAFDFIKMDYLGESGKTITKQHSNSKNT